MSGVFCVGQAQEQFEGCPVTEKVDVFAFGVLLWECFEQQQPWKDLSPMQIIYAVGLQVTLLVLDYRQLLPGVMLSLAQFKCLESLHALPAGMMTCHGL